VNMESCELVCVVLSCCFFLYFLIKSSIKLFAVLRPWGLFGGAVGSTCYSIRVNQEQKDTNGH